MKIEFLDVTASPIRRNDAVELDEVERVVC